MQMLNQALAHLCTQRGKKDSPDNVLYTACSRPYCMLICSIYLGCFLFVRNDSSFMKEEEVRMDYFCFDLEARDALRFGTCTTSASALRDHITAVCTRQAALSGILRALHQIGRDIGRNAPSGVEWAEQDFSVSLFKKARANIRELFIGSTRSENLARLASLRHDISGAKLLANSQAGEHSAAVEPLQRNLILLLNELIVLVDQANECEEVRKGLSTIFEEWIYNACIAGAALQSGRNDPSTSLLSTSTTDTLASDVAVTLDPQNRRRITDALLTSPTIIDDGAFSTLYIPCVLFSLVKDSVVVSTMESFQLFVEQYGGGEPLETLWTHFAFGIHQLFYCGLLKGKHGNKDDTLYERTALVWCSGD